MSDMVRISLNVARPQVAWLNDEAKRLGISVSEIVRRLIDKERGA